MMKAEGRELECDGEEYGVNEGETVWACDSVEDAEALAFMTQGEVMVRKLYAAAWERRD